MTYTTVTGEKLPSGSLELIDGMDLTIYHPDGPVAKIIFQDALNRVDSLLTGPASKQDFVRAMRAYFIAMPFYRGSAAIGRIAFSALFLHLFQHTIALPASVDTFAITATEDEYENFLAQFLGD